MKEIVNLCLELLISLFCRLPSFVIGDIVGLIVKNFKDGFHFGRGSH